MVYPNIRHSKPAISYELNTVMTYKMCKQLPVCRINRYFIKLITTCSWSSTYLLVFILQWSNSLIYVNVFINKNCFVIWPQTEQNARVSAKRKMIMCWNNLLLLVATSNFAPCVAIGTYVLMEYSVKDICIHHFGVFFGNFVSIIFFSIAFEKKF